MTHIHLSNQYEIIGIENYNKGGQTGSFYRDLLAIEANDLYINLHKVDIDYLNYIIELKKLPLPQEWLLDASQIFDDELFAEKLAKFIKPSLSSKISCFNPFIETPQTAALAEQINLPLKWTSKEIVSSCTLDRFNDKYHFKRLCEENSVKIIPWKGARNKKALVKAINALGSLSNKIIVKSSYSGGGFGNRAGTAEELLASMNSWYKSGIYLIEPFLEIKNTIGSLAVVQNYGVEFIGLDEQIIENLTWKGCDYPFSDKEFSAYIREKTLDLGRIAWNYGIRGFLNIDWAIAKCDRKLDCFAIECNFRDNGFNFILNATQSIFRLSPEVAKIKYISNVPITKCETKLGAILESLSKIMVNDKSIVIRTREDREQEGLIVTSYKEGNHSIGLLLAAKSEEYLQEALAKIYAII